MPKIHSTFICQQCGYNSPQFLGKCPECGSWNSFVEQIESKGDKGNRRSRIDRGNSQSKVIKLSEIEQKDYSRIDSKIAELNRVLGGGIVKGSVVLLAGDPGIGKSTLLTQLAININNDVIASAAKQSSLETVKSKIATSLRSVNMNVAPRNDGSADPLYVAGEESAHQIKLRVERIDPKADLAVLNETDVDVICETIDSIKPALVIIDSIQTLETQDLSSVAGSVGQVRESAHRLQKIAKYSHIPIFLVGHVTKEGTIAGPKTLEHVVDVVLNLEGDPEREFRILRGSKNRFGTTDEVGIFEMAAAGMIEVTNPSKIFLAEKVNAPGSAVIASLNGLRPLLLEVQALVTKSNLSFPRRVGTGVDNNRLQLLVAVLQKRLGLNLYDQDIFVNITGGIKVTEPATDLGLAMAIISSFKDKPLPQRSVFIGEVGLLGELRAVRDLPKRASEAKKLGFTQIISFENAKSLSDAVKLSF